MAHDSLMPVYPRLLRRIRAALIDSIVFVIFIFSWLFSFGLFESVPLKVGSFVLGLLLLEPVLVSLTGGTIGHHAMGLRVEDSSTASRIGVLRATVRAFLRVILGAFSLIFILATRKHQAIHDSVSRSVVVLKHPDRFPETEKFKERELVPTGFELPSMLHRIMAILVYGILSLLLVSLVLSFFVSANCIDFDVCSDTDELVSAVLGLAWFGLLIPIVIFAWRGRLYGCRRRQAEPSVEQ